MKFKKPVSAILAAATLISSTSVVSFAAEDEAMKTALTYVKQRLTIPESLENFNHRTSISNNRTRYIFDWESNDPQKYEYLTVTICGKIITNFRHDKYEEDVELETQRYSFAKLSEDELIEKAEKWIKILNPTAYKNIEVDKDSLRVWLGNKNAKINIRRVSNGIPISGQNGSITINKDTGELISYNLNWIMGAGFAKPEKAISTAEAIDGFKAEIPVELVYTTEYDYETKVYTPHLIYRQGIFAKIDALTGKLSTFEESYDYYEGDVDVEEDCDEEVSDDAVAGANKVTFTDAEIEKMEKEGSLIKADEALETLKDMGIFEIADNAEISYSRCNFDENYNSYIRYFNFEANNNNYYPIGEDPTVKPDDAVEEEEVEEVDVEDSEYSGGSATINAETGEILDFSSWTSQGYDGKKLTEKNTLGIMNRYLDKIAGDKAEEFILETPDFSYSEYDKAGKPKKNAYITYAHTSSPRYAYDIPCTRESVSMSLNGNKKIANYSLNYLGIEYPEPENIISSDEAYDEYFDQIDYDLLYCCAIKDKKTLTAMIYNPSQNLYIDAFTGGLVNGNGSEIVSYEKGEYTDLEGSKYKEIAEKLYMYNVTLMDEEGRLNEDKAITRQEFSNLASTIGCYYYNRTGADAALTRQFAAKILTNNVLSEQCAEIPGIFKSSFSDVKENSKYVGYITVADALGYIKGKNGKFRPSAKITRGEALKLVYDYLNKE